MERFQIVSGGTTFFVIDFENFWDTREIHTPNPFPISKLHYYTSEYLRFENNENLPPAMQPEY